MVSHASTVQPASAEHRRVLAGGVDHLVRPETACRATHSTNGSRLRASSRTASCDGASKLPGTCIAIHAPARQLAGPAHQQLGVLGHPLQRGVAHHHVGVRLRRPRPRHRRRWRRARARAPRRPSPASCPTPRSTASGQRSDSVTVRLPGPATEVDDAARRLGTHPRQQVEERPAAMVGEGQVDVGIPHGRQCRTHTTHSAVRSGNSGCGDQQRTARCDRHDRPAPHRRDADRALAALRHGHCAASCTCGICRPRATATPSTPPPPRQARRAGRRGSSARSTRKNFITVDKPPASLWVTGAVGAVVRHEQLVGAGAAGADGCRGGRRAVRDRAPGGSPTRRTAPPQACSPVRCWPARPLRR